MSKELVENKIKELETKKEDFITSMKKAQQDVAILQRNVDACDGAIFSLNEVLKDINLPISSTEEVKA